MECSRSSSSTEQIAIELLSPFLHSNTCRMASGARIFVQYCPIGAINPCSQRILDRIMGSHQAFRVLSGFHMPDTLLEAEGIRMEQYVERFPLVPVIVQ